VGTVVVLEIVQVNAPTVPPDAFDTVYVAATPSATKETNTAPVPEFATDGVARALDTVRLGLDAADVVVKPVPLPLAVTVKLMTSPVVSPVKVRLCGPAATAVLPPAPRVLVASRVPEVVSTRLTVYSEATPSETHVTVAAPAPASLEVGLPPSVAGDAPSFALDTVAFEASDAIEDRSPAFGVTINVSVMSVTTQLSAVPLAVAGVAETEHVSAVFVTPLTV
jgi:hypothetical protein